MCTYKNRLVGVGMLLALVTTTPAAYAELVDNSDNSVSAWFAEGNVRCSDYFGNSVEEIAESSVMVGQNIEETGDPNPLDGDDQPETLFYTAYDTDGDELPDELEFITQTTAINAVIIKRSRTVNFYSMPPGGRGSDSGLDLDTGIDGDGVERLPISAVSFCYGIATDVTEESETMPACNFNIEGACQEGEAYECNVINGALTCCSCSGASVPGCIIDEPSVIDGGCGGTVNFQSLNLNATGTGSDIVCYPVKKRLTCYTY